MYPDGSVTLERYEGFDVYELNDPTHTLTTAGNSGRTSSCSTWRCPG